MRRDFDGEPSREDGRRAPHHHPGHGPRGAFSETGEDEGRWRGGPRGGGPRGGGRRSGGHGGDWHGSWHGHWRAVGGPGQGFGPAFFGRGSRAARGDVRAAVLALVGEQPMHGYQIIRELSERSGGVWMPSPGSVYPTLQLLEDEGLVTSEQQEGRRVYSATEAGRAVAAERRDRPAPWDEVASEADASLLDLREVAVLLMVASRQVAHAGNSSDVAKAKAVLTDARKALYGILAESPGDEPEGEPAD